MANYTQFQSTGGVFDFSKGPKSLYYGQGDDKLLGVVLNVPQTDQDDEWGQTQRIADERIIDRISTLITEVEDPYGTGTAGLLNKVAKLGTALDTATPKLTLGNVVIDGSTSTVTVGTGTSLTATKFTLGTNFTNTAEANVQTLAFKSVNSVKFSDDGTTRTIELIVNNKSWTFSDTALTIPVGASIPSGSVDLTNTGTITPATDLTYDVGSTAKQYSSVYAAYGVFSNAVGAVFFCGGTNAAMIGSSTVSLKSAFDGSTYFLAGASQNRSYKPLVPSSDLAYTLGTSGLQWSAIYGFNIVASGTVGASYFCGGTDAVFIGSSNLLFRNVFDGSNLFRITGSSVTTYKSLGPSTSGLNLGGSSARFENIYGNYGDYAVAITSPIFCGTGGLARTVGSGGIIFSSTYDSGTYFSMSSSGHYSSETIYPSSTLSYDLGSGALQWSTIYGQNIIASAAVGASIFCGGTTALMVGSTSVSFASAVGGTTYASMNATNVITNVPLRPASNNSQALGTNSYAYTQIWLYDVTLGIRRMYLNNGSVIIDV